MTSSRSLSSVTSETTRRRVVVPEWLLATTALVGLVILRQSSQYDARKEIEKLQTSAYETLPSNQSSTQRWGALFEEAGVQSIDLQIVQKLPDLQQVEAAYGKGPHIVGLERCEEYRKGQPAAEAVLAIAGNFNTNTNHLFNLLNQNCDMPMGAHDGILWQVPWSKHQPAEHRLDHTADWRLDRIQDLDRDTVLPIVTVRDPYYWMQAMCRKRYAAIYKREGHCPNLVLEEDGQNNQVNVHYNPEKYTFASLADFWSSWNNQYYRAEYPRLIVRFEDILFHTKETVKQVCECAGGTLKKKGSFHYDMASVKALQDGPNATNFIDAITKYGNLKHRLDGYEPADLKHAKKYVDPKLLKALHYQDISVL